MNRSLSLYLNLMRFLAAMAVYLFHGQGFANARVPYVGNMGSEAVFVFFVLSGMLITYSSQRQLDGASFVRARLARLWSVCLPALALTLLADMLGQYISLASYTPMQPYDAFKWVASIVINALFLNQIWNLSIYAGTNGPFWSLSYEFWYYMIFASWIYFTGKKRFVAVAFAALIAGPAILVGLPIWLMGSAAYFASVRNRASKIAGWACWLGSLAAALAFSAFDLGAVLSETFPKIAGGAKWKVDFWPESYLIGAIVAINIYGFSLIGTSFQTLLTKFSRPIQLGADISFGLYLFHYPLMYLARAVLYNCGLASGPVFIAVVYITPFVAAAALAIKCEKRKDVVAGLIDRATFIIRGWILSRTKSIASIGSMDPLAGPSSTSAPSEGNILP